MKKIILNIVKYAICKILWCLILCKFFNFIQCVVKPLALAMGI